MQTRFRFVTGLALAVFAVGCAGRAQVANAQAEAETPKKEAAVLPETTYTTEQFAQKVTDAGGRVDFVFGDDRPFPQCHASTLVEAENGDVLCAWFGGTKEKAPDVGIWLSIFTDGAWTAPEQVAKLSDFPHWNPVLFRDPARGLYLFFKVGPDPSYWQTYWMESEDNGRTWSEAKPLIPGDVGGRGPVKNKAIVLTDGAWLAPASTEIGDWKPFADRSEDAGKTWQRSDDWAIDKNEIPGKGGIQATFWESEPGHVHALMRTTGRITGRADSTDYGRTWSKVYPTALPNNNSGIDLVKLDDGRLLLVYNPVGEDWGARTPLNLAVSADNGETWQDIVSLETAPGEYSYPAIVRTDDGVAISYTWKRERVRCWQVPLEALGE